MKKVILLTVSMVMVLLLLTGCSNKVSRELDFGGEKVKVTVDLKGGWDADWGNSVVYLYDQKNEEGVEAVGWGVYFDAAEVPERVEEITNTYAEDYTNVQQFEDGSIKWWDAGDEYASGYYLKRVSDKSFIMIVCQNPDEAEAFFDRFDAELVK